MIPETVGFVDKLFECLTSKNYQGNSVAKEAPKEVVNLPPAKSDAVEVRRNQLLCFHFLNIPREIIAFFVDIVRLRLQRRREKTDAGEVL